MYGNSPSKEKFYINKQNIQLDIFFENIMFCVALAELVMSQLLSDVICETFRRLTQKVFSETTTTTKTKKKHVILTQ